ncbi:AAA family ATPase [Belnapia rosea]|uniref:ATP-dependent Zn proteases n=1 Tax=Belnapia rosea TaxID=938405 RepID=A0A1G7C049_9PROT|nr:AAA family ATPase [Belnapia rosea]SDE32643.1 ATP-dependent Zn proteases [Belnapia rosea]
MSNDSNNASQPRCRSTHRRLARKSPSLPPDLAEEVAAVMVHRLLADRPGLAAEAKVPGSVTIVAVAAKEWVMHIRRAWVGALFPGEEPEVISTWPLATETDEGEEQKPPEPRWYGFARDDATRRTDPYFSADSLITAFQSGQPVFGWSQDPEALLPGELLRMADRVVQVPPPSPAALAEAVASMAGALPTEDIPEAVARAAMPHHLLMAWQPGASADEVLHRLVRIVGTAALAADPRERLESLLGMDEARDWGLAVARDLPEYRAGRLAWADIDKAVLLAGPPGTGKTSFARRMANTCDVPLVISSPQEWQGDRDGHLGHALGAMQRTFREARASAPCILFLDEIDSMGDRARYDERHRDYSTAYLNGLLEQLDGLHGREGVIVVAACNHPDRLDPALTRSGRLDRVLHVPLPDDQALAGILRQRLRDEIPGADLMRVVRLAVGATGADVERWVRSARRRARHAGRPLVLEDLLAEVRPKVGDMPTDIRRRAAVHEAGHALVGWLEMPGSLVRVSLAGGPDAGGFAENLHEPVLTREAVGRHLRRLFAGRAAEQVILGDVSSGAGGSERSDLARATMLAVSALTSWGFSSAPADQHLLWHGQPGPSDMRLILPHQPSLAREVGALLADAYEGARALIEAHRPALQRIAQALLEREVLVAEEIAHLVEQPRSLEEAPERDAPRRMR